MHQAFIVVAIFTGIIFVAVEGALIVFIVKYRRGKRARTAEGPQMHGSTRLEVIWTVVPVVFLAAIGAFVFYKLPGIKDPPNAQAANSTRILVEGHQFFWQFRYPNGAISIDRMVAPADEVVNEDIIGPALRRHPLVVGARLRRQVRRDPGPRQHDLVQGACRQLPGALLRALRDPARCDARDRARRAARAIRRVRDAGALHRRASSHWDTRSGRARA